MTDETESSTTSSRKRQARKEGTSARKARKEELARKQRQQRIIVVGAIAVIALAVIGLLIYPAINRAANPAGEFTKVTPLGYENADGFHLGDPNAPVKIEVFEDFKCTACRTYALDIEPTVIKELVLTGKVYYTFYQFPFLDDSGENKDSDRSAMAAMCAADQNRFWDYKNILFTNQRIIAGEFSDVRLKAFADSLDLDMGAFNTCYDTKAFQSTIDEHINLGEQLGVQGTPSVFINGKDVSPGKVPTFDEIAAAVQAAASGQ